MDTVSLNQFFLIFTNFCYIALVAILALIARFYEHFTGTPTYFRYYLLPIALSAAATVRYASLDQWAGDALGDFLMFANGSSLSALCYHLYHQMTRGKK